jgi:ABC-type transport system substrate-binding protein
MERDTHPDGPVRTDLASRPHALARREFLARMTALGAGVAAAAAGADLATPGPAFAQATQKRELVVAQGGDVATFDPHMRTAANDIRVSFNIFEAGLGAR